MFVGREYELAELEKYYREGAFQFAVFYGRRRVGKTTLINKFRENKKSIYFTATETTAKENLELLSVQILGTLAPQSPKNPFASFHAAFEYCFKAAKKRLILIIDEYPYLAESDRAVSSILQTLIDKYRESSRLFLILCGSSMSFMENQVLGYKSPLYGRRTCQFKIQPFSYYESARMLPAFNNIEKIALYGIVGGIPEYLSRINNKISLAQNVEALFFNPSGRLFEEPSNLLKQELQSPQTYNGIIAAIASGAGKVNEIASRAGIETSQCSNMLGTLAVLGIVRKEYPAGSEKPSRKTIYRLSDNMFRFWYRFVLPELSRISMGYGKQACAEIFGRSESGGVFETYMGPVFEDCSIQYLWRSAKNNSRYKYIGRWWGANPKAKQEEEIDILAADGHGNMLFGECKWRNNRAGNDVLAELVRKSELFSAALKKKYILFSKSGFTAELVKTAKQRGDTELVNLAKLLIE
jgi:AAA+ ATPase superfamily predicted ATPase